MPRVFVLTDGPHQIDAPTGREVAALQRLGYQVDHQFSPFSLITHVTEGKDAEGNIVAQFADDSEFDFTAIADHIAVLMRDPAWDRDRVAESFCIDKIGDYYAALRALAEEAFGGEPDPKVTSGGSPE